MTTPIERAAHEAVSGTGPQPAQPVAPPHGISPQAWYTAVPRWFRVVWREGEAVVSHMAPVATNPLLDELIDEALMSAGANVAAQVFEGAIDALRGARERQAAQPAPAAPGGTGADGAA